MGTQQSSRHASSLPLRSSPRSSSLSALRQTPGSSSALRSLGLDDPASPFASPPKPWHSDERGFSPKGSSPPKPPSPKGASRWRSRSCAAASPLAGSAYFSSSVKEASNQRADSPDIEAGKADLEPGSTTNVSIDIRRNSLGGAEVGTFEIFDKAAIQDAVLNRKSSKVAHKSGSSSCKNSGQLALADSYRPSLAKGSSAARPRWTRPRPSIASGSRPSSAGSKEMEANSLAGFHPNSLANDLSSLQHLEDPTIASKDAYYPEPPPTPSTISDSEFYRTQSSLSSGSSWMSRPTTRSSASSSNPWIDDRHHNLDQVVPEEDEAEVDCSRDRRIQPSASSGGLWGSSRDPQLVVPAEDRHEVLVNCSRDSRGRATGARKPSKETSQRLSSVKTAWAAETMDSP